MIETWKERKRQERREEGRQAGRKYIEREKKSTVLKQANKQIKHNFKLSPLKHIFYS